MGWVTYSCGDIEVCADTKLFRGLTKGTLWFDCETKWLAFRIMWADFLPKHSHCGPSHSRTHTARLPNILPSHSRTHLCLTLTPYALHSYDRRTVLRSHTRPSPLTHMYWGQLLMGQLHVLRPIVNGPNCMYWGQLLMGPSNCMYWGQLYMVPIPCIRGNSKWV